eukprot:353182-Chlamydomonas_euryale.AAC.4
MHAECQHNAVTVVASAIVRKRKATHNWATVSCPGTDSMGCLRGALIEVPFFPASHKIDVSSTWVGRVHVGHGIADRWVFARCRNYRVEVTCSRPDPHPR